MKLSQQSHILFCKGFFGKELNKPPGNFLLQEHCKSPQAHIFSVEKKKNFYRQL